MLMVHLSVFTSINYIMVFMVHLQMIYRCFTIDFHSISQPSTLKKTLRPQAVGSSVSQNNSSKFFGHQGDEKHGIWNPQRLW